MIIRDQLQVASTNHLTRGAKSCSFPPALAAGREDGVSLALFPLNPKSPPGSVRGPEGTPSSGECLPPAAAPPGRTWTARGHEAQPVSHDCCAQEMRKRAHHT